MFEENKENLPLVFINNRDSKNIYIWNILYQTKKILEENILNKENLKSVLDGVYFNLYDTSDVSWHLIKIHFKLIDYYLKGTWKEKKDIVKVLEAIWWDYDINLDTFTLYYSNFFNTFIKNIKKNNIKWKLVAITDNLFINLWTNWKLYSLNKKSELILVDDNYIWYNNHTLLQQNYIYNENQLLLKDRSLVGLFKDWTLKIFNKDWSLSKEFDLNSLLKWTKVNYQVSILDCRLSQNYVYIYWRWTGKFIQIDINKDKVEYFDFWELKYICLWEDKSDELLISKMKNNDYLSLFWLKRDQESYITQTASYYDKFSNKDVSIYKFSDYKWIDTIDYSRFKQYLIFLKADHTDDYDYYDGDNFPFYEMQSNCFLCYWLQWIKKSFIIDKRKISSTVDEKREEKLYFLETMLRRYNIYSHLFSFRKYDLENQNQDSEEDFLNLWSKGKLVKKSSNIAVFWRVESLSTNNFYVGLDCWKIWVILPNILR